MLEIGIAAGFSALVIGVGHWFPWRQLLHRELHRLEAYVYGVLAIVVPVVVVLQRRGDVFTTRLLVACVLAAGAATLLGKLIDLIAAYRNELHDRRRRDA